MEERRRAFGSWLRDEVHKAGLGHNEFARRAGVSSGQLSQWMSGARHPTPQSCRKLAQALGLSEDVVLYHARHKNALTYPEEHYRLQQSIDSMRDQLDRLAEEGVETTQGVAIRYVGPVPADSARWVSLEETGAVERVPEQWIGSRPPDDFLIVRASGDCLLTSEGIRHGHYVLIRRLSDLEKPQDGAVTLVRLHDEVTLKHWHAISPTQVELRDGNGRIARTLSVMEDFEVLGVYHAHWNVRSV